MEQHFFSNLHISLTILFRWSIIWESDLPSGQFITGEQTIEYLTVPLELDKKQLIDEGDPDFFKFDGLAAAFGNIDMGRDIIEPGAFTESLKEREPKLLWQHNMREPVGIVVASEDSKGLRVQGTMPKADTLVSGRIIPQMQIGSVKSMSIGFNAVESEFDEDRNIRIIKEIDLFEVSLVTIGMNDQAVITSMKSLNDLREIENIGGVEAALKEYGLSNTVRKVLISKMKEFSGETLGDDTVTIPAEGDGRDVAKLEAQLGELKNGNLNATLDELIRSSKELATHGRRESHQGSPG